jgi:hypothetical protein
MLIKSQDMHYADFGADEVSSFVRLTAGPLEKTCRADMMTEYRITASDQRIRDQ